MNGVKIEVQGAKELRSILRQIGDKDLKTALREANKIVSQLVVAEALPNVPVRTGRLRQSVKALATLTTAYGKAGSAAVAYAPAVHWGTGPRVGRKGPHNIARRPFLSDAADRVADRAAGAYQTAVQELLDRAVRG